MDVDVGRELEAAADLIGRCYDDLKPSAETVRDWTAHPVFDARLWVWVVEASTGRRVALGIAELDTAIAEGSLEWIQVVPEYRGQGIGNALVTELVSRLQHRARSTTVAGMMNNENIPLALYRRCGFIGRDVWWILRAAN